MKNSNVFLFTKLLVLITAFSFFSCSNEINTENINIDNAKINIVLKEKKIETQKIYYQLLTSSQKLKIWTERLNSIVESDERLTSKQKNLIHNISISLKEEYFSNETNDEKEYFKNILVENFLNELKMNFNNSQISDIFYGLGNKYADRDDSCNCNIGSLFGCSANCDENSLCKYKYTGCGFLWGWECNGRCRLL